MFVDTLFFLFPAMFCPICKERLREDGSPPIGMCSGCAAIGLSRIGETLEPQMSADICYAEEKPRQQATLGFLCSREECTKVSSKPTRCGRCLNSPYCSRECSLLDRHVHKKFCYPCETDDPFLVFQRRVNRDLEDGKLGVLELSLHFYVWAVKTPGIFMYWAREGPSLDEHITDIQRGLSGKNMKFMTKARVDQMGATLKKDSPPANQYIHAALAEAFQLRTHTGITIVYFFHSKDSKVHYFTTICRRPPSSIVR